MQRLNILVLSHTMPVFPGGAGHEYLHLLHLRPLAGHIGLVSQIHTSVERDAANRLAQAGIDLYLFENLPAAASQATVLPPTAASRARARIRNLAGTLLRLLSREPFDIRANDLYFRNVAPALLEALAERVWHVLIVVQSNAAHSIDCLPSFQNSVLVYHDIRARVFERRALLPLGFWDRFQSSINARRYWRFEAKYAHRYDECVALSRDDADAIRAVAPTLEPLVVPIPVDTDYFRRSKIAEDPDLIVFSGMMNHPPNIDAVKFLVECVLPAIRTRHPAVRLAIVGKHPVPEIQAYGAEQGVEITGFVPDIRPYIERAALVVVPLRFASGVRNKILEAWSLEKCVVSTTIGAEGLDYSENVDIVIADSTREIADAIVGLLRDQDRRHSIGRKGRKVVLARHQPGVVAQTYYRGLRRGLDRRSARPRRLAFDLRWMIPGRAGGLEVLARSFIGELAALDATDDVTLLLPAVCAEDFDLRSRPNFRILASPAAQDDMNLVGNQVGRRVASALGADFWKSREVEALLRLRKLDAEIVFSFPGYIFPDVRPCKHVVMVADIQHEFYPEFFPNGALEERRKLFGDAIEIAEHVVAISDFTRETLINRLGVAPAKITTIHLAAGEHFTNLPCAGDAEILKKYRLSLGQYLYLPGHTWHHKNHATAVRTLDILRRKGRDVCLVLTGASREANHELLTLIKSLELLDRVRFLGYCPHADIAALYRQAATLVFPSLFEGFGMPVLEAMASGCPVVCSDSTSLPEIGGEAALYAPALDAEGMASHVDTLLANPHLRSAMVERGLRRATQFSWRKHTIDTMKVIDQVHRRLFG